MKNKSILLVFGFSVFLSSAAQAIPFSADSTYYPRYTHTTTGGTPSITTTGRTAIYIRQAGHVYMLVPMSGGRFWARQAWGTMEDRIEQDHAAAVIDVPADANPVALVINGKAVSFNSFMQLGGHKGQIQPVSGGGPDAPHSGSSGSSSSSGVDIEEQDTKVADGGGHDGSVPLCQLLGTCGTSSSSGSTASSGGIIIPDASSGGTVPVETKPLRSCTGGAGTPNVTPSSFAAAVSRLGSGQTLTLAPGSYPRVSLKSKSYGGATIQCAEAGKCTLGPGSVFDGVEGLTISGFKVTGTNLGMNFNNARNIMVRCSEFIRQTMTGILVTGERSANVNFYENRFFNDLTTKIVSDGYPDGGMDYAIRLYDAQSVGIKGNVFEGLFNHGISLKGGVLSTVITENKFNDCGRLCINTGQVARCVGKLNVNKNVIISNNTFTNIRRRAIAVMNSEINTITGNRFDGRGNVYDAMYFTGNEPSSRNACQGRVFNRGVPDNRRINASGNTVR